jgi:hypothetical protein
MAHRDKCRVLHSNRDAYPTSLFRNRTTVLRIHPLSRQSIFKILGHYKAAVIKSAEPFVEMLADEIVIALA